MRILGLLLLLAAAGIPQDEKPAEDPKPKTDAPKVDATKTDDGPPPAHDELGFPITFNDEIITRSDVKRSLGPGEYPAITIKNTRNKLLREKLLERVAANLGILVEDAEVREMLRRNIEMAQGEAKYYEELAQRGSSLERERVALRRQLLQSKLRFLFQSGVSVNRRDVLPWRVVPTPREIRIAYRADPARRAAGLRVRRQEMKITLSRKERSQVVRRLAAEGTDMTTENLTKAFEAELRPLVDRAVASLEGGTPFAEVAKANGATNIDAQADAWIEVPKGETDVPAEQFFQRAKPGTYSKPIEQDGVYWVYYLIERVNPTDQSLSDPKVVEEYRAKIADLRSQKWRAIFDLRALDGSIVKPDRVRDEIREELVKQLKDAETRLRALGLH